MKLNNFRIDTQNSTATFFFSEPPPEGLVGSSPWVNIAVHVEDADSKTGSLLKKEAAENALRMLKDVISQMKDFE